MSELTKYEKQCQEKIKCGVVWKLKQPSPYYSTRGWKYLLTLSCDRMLAGYQDTWRVGCFDAYEDSTTGMREAELTPEELLESVDGEPVLVLGAVLRRTP